MRATSNQPGQAEGQAGKEEGAQHKHLVTGVQPAAHSAADQERSFYQKMPFCRRPAILPLDTSCEAGTCGRGTSSASITSQGCQTRCTRSRAARHPTDQTAIHHLGAHSAPLPAEVEAKKAVPKSEEAERMRQLSGNATRTRKVFVGGLPPSVDETAFRWDGTLDRRPQAASASRSCCRPSTCPNATWGPLGSLAHSLSAPRLGTMPCLLQEVF